MTASRERILQLLQKSIDHLQHSGMLEQPVVIDDNTVLLGSDAALDSLVFVAFITDVEERLNAETGRDLVLVLKDIPDFDSDEPNLPVDTLVRHLILLASPPAVSYGN